MVEIMVDYIFKKVQKSFEGVRSGWFNQIYFCHTSPLAMNPKVYNFGIFPNWGQNIYVMPKEARVWMKK